jgi:hypothetical protein
MDEKEEEIVVNVGDVVRARYLTYEGIEKIGYFLIISDDKYISHSLKGYNALKISSNGAFYEIELDSSRFTFLDHTSYINCGHQQRLYSKMITKNCGVVSADILCRVVKQLENFNKDINKQLDTTIKYFNRIASATVNRQRFLDNKNADKE